MLYQRILSRIETMPEFEAGQKVAILANNTVPVYQSKRSEFNEIKYDVGLRTQFVGFGEGIGNEHVTSWKGCALINNMLGVSLEPASKEEIAAIRRSEEYMRMDIWPAQDSIAVIDGTIVVNFLYPINIDVQLNAENEIIFSLKGEEALPEGCTYAWYLYKDGKRTNVQWYQEKPVYVTGQLEAGEYYTTLFIKDSNGEAVCNVTSDKYKL